MSEPLSNKPTITQNDILKGYVKRYFVQHISIKRIIEVDKKQYDIFKTDPLYQTLELDWTISGFSDNTTAKNGDVVYGTRHKNQIITEWNDQKMPGLRRMLQNPLEYFSGLMTRPQQPVLTPIKAESNAVPLITTTTSTTSTTTTTTTFPPITADYWWRADYGLTTSSWDAYNGGINFTLFNVSTANATDGIALNGFSSYGQTSNLVSDIDAKHVFIRFEVDAPLNNGTFLGGTQDNIHEIYYTAGGLWYIVETNPPNPGIYTYAARTFGGVSQLNTALWIDFANGGTPQYYTQLEDTANNMEIYAGSYTNKFTWQAGSGILLGTRQQAGSKLYANIKEVAIFTSSLSVAEAKDFRNEMLSRWPIPPATTTTTIAPTTTTTTTLAQVYDIVGPQMTLTRANNMGLYNSSLESGWVLGTSPSGSEWSSGYVSNYPLVWDTVDAGLILTRQVNRAGGGFFNTASESSWDGSGYTSPAGTEWNSIHTDAVNYGWGNLSNVTTRTYDTFTNALDFWIGRDIVATELVMHDTINDKYYKFDVTSWGQGGTGAYSYSRQLIDTSSGALVGSPVIVTQSFWNDFSDVTSRTYDTFYNALDGEVGRRAVPTELIMHDTINSKYYKFDITAWGSASQGATYAYNRQEINTGTGLLSGSIVYVSRP